MPEQSCDLLKLKGKIAERAKRAIEAGGHTRQSIVIEIHEKLRLKVSTAYAYLKSLENKGDPVSTSRGDNKFTPKRIATTKKLLSLLDVREDDDLIEELNRYASSMHPNLSSSNPSSADAEPSPPLPIEHPHYNDISAQIPNGVLTRGGYIIPKSTETERRFLNLLEEAEKFYPNRSAETFFQGIIRDYDKGNREQRRGARRELVRVIRANREEQKIHDRKVT